MSMRAPPVVLSQLPAERVARRAEGALCAMEDSRVPAVRIEERDAPFPLFACHWPRRRGWAGAAAGASSGRTWAIATRCRWSGRMSRPAAGETGCWIRSASISPASRANRARAGIGAVAWPLHLCIGVCRSPHVAHLLRAACRCASRPAARRAGRRCGVRRTGGAIRRWQAPRLRAARRGLARSPRAGMHPHPLGGAAGHPFRCRRSHDQPVSPEPRVACGAGVSAMAVRVAQACLSRIRADARSGADPGRGVAVVRFRNPCQLHRRGAARVRPCPGTVTAVADRPLKALQRNAVDDPAGNRSVDSTIMPKWTVSK